MPIKVSIAVTDQEREAALRLRYDVYTRQMGLYRDVADHAGKRLCDEDDPGARFLIAWDGDTAVGAVRVHLGDDGPIPPGLGSMLGLASIENDVPERAIGIVTRFTIAPAHRGGAVGLALIVAVAELCLDHDVEIALLDCIPDLANMYIEIGFRPHAPTCSDPDAGFLIPMAFVLADVQHLRSMNSPLLGIIERRMAGRQADEGLLRRLFTRAAVVAELAGGIESVLQAAGGLGSVAGSPFEGMTEEEIRGIVRRSLLVFFADGDRIIARRTRGRSAWVLLSGRADAVMDDGNVRSMLPAEIFGEISFLLDRPRTADVISRGDGVVGLYLDERTLQRTMKAAPATGCRLMLNIARTLARRLTTPPVAGVST